MPFLAHILATILLFGVWAMAGGTIASRFGLLCLCIGAVASAGAYAFALTARLLSVGSGWIAAALAGAILGYVVLLLAGRLRDHDYALGTFALMLVWEGVVSSATPVTGGPFGLPAAPALPLAARTGAPAALVALAAGLLVVGAAALGWERTRRLRTAADLLARSRELAAVFAAPPHATLTAYGLAIGTITGLGGALLGAYLGYVGPTLIGLSTSILIAALALAFERGAIALVTLLLILVMFPELLRLLPTFGVDGASLRATLAGGALIGLEFSRSRRPAIRP